MCPLWKQFATNEKYLPFLENIQKIMDTFVIIPLKFLILIYEKQ